ncbi:MAG: 1-deoxy-D-xylulose-5-phosphate synthase [Gemmatimonadetes bacterium]|nr:1-deoxy-D-xylulose-5-phosphate synthase [Gemmatimonadota bacterium]
MSLLDRAQTPDGLRQLSREQLPQLAQELRDFLIQTCAVTGGHIGAGLGVVELTIALHYVFDTPTDQLVWDVGHQGYPHKVLTGRRDRFDTLRQEDGISGFLKRSESPYDTFGAGHAATSISAAVGMAFGRDLKGGTNKVVAIIGDGSLGSGLAYEGLNNAGASDSDIVVILNDNEMSIAPNVGAMHKYLTQVQRNPIYNRLRSKIGELVDQQPMIGGIVRKWEESVKSFLTPGVLFEELGFRYFGPIDGHDTNELIDTLRDVRDMKGPRLVHVITQKGKGFPAGEHGEKWHALPPGHDPATGKQVKAAAGGNPNYTAVFGNGLAEIMTEKPEVVAITAAMPSGTGTGTIAKAHPKRVFDVGIAEGHGVTFAGGLATTGARPVVAIYSTFLQRGYDNIIHDVAIQNLPVVFAMDRAGLVGEDGETHAGLYDIAYMLAVPGMTVTAPRDGAELLGLLKTGLAHPGPFAVRYPRDTAPDTPPHSSEIAAVPFGTWDVVRKGHDVAILAVGTMVNLSLKAAETLAAEGLDVTVVNCRFMKPYDALTLAALLSDHKHLLVVEEGTVVNGFGAYLAGIVDAMDPTVRVIPHGVPDRIIYAAARARQLAQCGLDAAGIADKVRALHESEAVAG